MDQINKKIVDITYAIGTGPGGVAGVTIDGDGQDVVTNNNGGDDSLTPEVGIDVASGGHEDDNVVDDGNGGMASGTSGEAPSDTIDETDNDESNTLAS